MTHTANVEVARKLKKFLGVDYAIGYLKSQGYTGMRLLLTAVFLLRG